MTNDEAVKIVTQACNAVPLTWDDQLKIREALRMVEAAMAAKPPEGEVVN